SRHGGGAGAGRRDPPGLSRRRRSRRQYRPVRSRRIDPLRAADSRQRYRRLSSRRRRRPPGRGAVFGGVRPGIVRAARRTRADPRRARPERSRGRHRARRGAGGFARRTPGRGGAGVTRRLLQAMAGARHGGAETFFVRLAGALQRAGQTQRVVIRHCPDRSGALREAGVAVTELRFGAPFDVASRIAFRREIAEWRPDIVLTWMNRATAMCPTGDFVHVGRLGGYYDLKYYRRCDHLIGNTRAIVDYV